MSNLFVLPNLQSQSRLSAVRLMSGGVVPEAAPADNVNDIIANAANANNAVLAYVRGLSSTKLPFVPDSPAWYNDFTKSYANIGANALYWQNSLSPRLIEIPRTIYSYGSLFDLKVLVMRGYLEQLIHNPNNPTAREKLRDALVELIQGIDTQQRAVNTFGTDLAGFSTTLKTDAGVLADCVKKAMNEIGQDQGKIRDLQKRIEELKKEMAGYNWMIGGGGIAIGVSIFIGCVGAVLTAAFGPIGLLVVGIGVIGAAAGVAAMIAGKVKVDQIGNEIKAQSANLDRVQQRVAALSTVKTNVENLIVLSNTAQAEIGKLVTAWDLLKGGMQAVVTDLGNANKKFQASQFIDMKSDIGQAEDDWKYLAELAKKFANINIKVEEEISVIGQRKAA